MVRQCNGSAAPYFIDMLTIQLINISTKNQRKIDYYLVIRSFYIIFAPPYNVFEI